MNISNRISPASDLHQVLMSVEEPARYVGGEFGSVVNQEEADLTIALSFPELYEIAMSNTAIRILYQWLNGLPGVACERVFSPAHDFEQALNQSGTPLYTLETGIALQDVDVLAFSIGYELLATNVLTIIQSGGIPVERAARSPTDPIVIGGGPGITNPIPWGGMLDAVYLGEFEEEFLQLATRMRDLRRRGATRDALLDVLRSSEHVWYPGRADPVKRAVWSGFGASREPEMFTTFPVPTVRVIQDHGVVEIMRGCPQGCRFCHAGIFYRPYRMKSTSRVVAEVEDLVSTYGFRDITLSSLSSGDYSDLYGLVTELNRRFGHRGINFQVPSLRVNSFTLPLLEELSKVRKSHLTFAVETGSIEDQLAMNKLVPLERTIAILSEAEQRGWRSAKFYFMIGLPVGSRDEEVANIIDYVQEVKRAGPGIKLTVNVGTFVPKPHTPFQWESQMSEHEAVEAIRSLKTNLPNGVVFRYHSPFMSTLEGVIARGDAGVADLLLEAHRRGARFDAWQEHCDRELWHQLFREHPGALRGLREFSEDERLPWTGVRSGASMRSLIEERTRAKMGLLTERCLPNCRHRCGVCNQNTRVVDGVNDLERWTGDSTRVKEQTNKKIDHGRKTQLLVTYRKVGRARYIPHLALVRIFERAWNRSNLPVVRSTGHHPKAKFSFCQPLSVGIEGHEEVLTVEVHESVQPEGLSQSISTSLPEGLEVVGLTVLRRSEQRIPSPMQLFWGAEYQVVPLDGKGLGGSVGELWPKIQGLAPGARCTRNDSGLLQFVLPINGNPGIGKLLRSLRALRGGWIDCYRVVRLRPLAGGPAIQSKSAGSDSEDIGDEPFGSYAAAYQSWSSRS